MIKAGLDCDWAFGWTVTKSSFAARVSRNVVDLARLDGGVKCSDT